MQDKTTKTNTLDIYRRKMRFSTMQVARLFGDTDVSRISKYERGHRLPNLPNAFRLGIILRVPVEFLFPSLYDSLRGQIRREEERLRNPSQVGLF